MDSHNDTPAGADVESGQGADTPSDAPGEGKKLRHFPYALRAIIVIICFPTLPALPVLPLTLGWIPETWGWVALIWFPIGIVLWGLLARQLLVKGRYVCEACGKKEGRINPARKILPGDRDDHSL